MYKDRWSRSAAKFYERLDAQTKRRIDDAVREICIDPVRAPGVKPLTGELWGKRRRRIGDFRLIYTHDTREEVAYVLVLNYRKSVYR